MYFIELLVKYLKKDRLMEILDQHENYEACEHIFMPVDSTGETLACSKCGLVVQKKDLRYKNFFMNKSL